MEMYQALYRLQSLESSLDDGKKRLAEIDDEIANNELLKAAQADHDAAVAEHRTAEASVNDLALELKGLEQRRTENQEFLYSGKVKDPREMQERQDEIASLDRRHETLTAQIDEANRVLDAAAQALQSAEEALASVKEQVAEENQALTQEQETLRQEMQKWLQRRKKTLKTVNEDHYKLYKKLKKQKNGVAVARLDGDECAVCRGDQTQTIVHQVRQGKDIVYCNNCGRILVEA